MNELVIDQLKELANHMDWTLVLVKDEDNNIVMVTIGDEGWVDEFYGDAY